MTQNLCCGKDAGKESRSGWSSDPRDKLTTGEREGLIKVISICPSTLLPRMGLARRSQSKTALNYSSP